MGAEAATRSATAAAATNSTQPQPIEDDAKSYPMEQEAQLISQLLLETADPLYVSDGQWQGAVPIEDMPAATEDMPAAENSASTVMLEEAVEEVTRVAVAESKRKPTAGEAAAKLGLDPVGRDDWVAYFANETNKEKQELLIAATSFADRNGGTLISQTAELCACCYEETTECFPCAGAHKMCRKCRSENQENVIEKCPVCRTSFQMAEAIHGRSYDRTFQNVEHPMLKQLLTLELKCWKPQLKEAERQAAEDSDELSETQKLLLMANDVQTHHSHGVAGLSDTVVYNGKTDMSLGETEQLCFCSAGRDTQGSGPFQFTKPGGNQRYSFMQRCETCDVRRRHQVWMEAVRTIKQIEDHYQTQAFWHRCRRQEGADRRRAQRCMDYVRAKSETLEGERMVRMDMETKYPNAEPTRYLNMADTITEVTFIHMREQVKGVLQIHRDEWTKMRRRDLERTRRANGLLYPLEHSVRRWLQICAPPAFALHLPHSRTDLEVAGSRLSPPQMLRGDRGLPGGAHYNKFGQLDGWMAGCSGRPGHLEPKLTAEARRKGMPEYVEWGKIREQMVKDLKANKADWRGYDFTEDDLFDKEGNLRRPGTGQKYRAHFWSTVSGDNPIPGSPPAVPNLPAGAEDDLVALGGGTKRPSALDIWLTPMQYPGIQLYQSEADEILDMFTGPNSPWIFGPDSEMARVAAGFGDGPAILINTMRKVREFPIEVEGEMHDGRWINMAIEDPWHPLPANPKDLEEKGIITQHDWPELHHVVSVELPDKTQAWRMIRSEVLSEQPWSKPSQADTAQGVPALIGLDGDNWFGDAFRNGRIELGEVSKVEPPKFENFPQNHPLRNTNHHLALPDGWRRAFPPRLDWTEVSIEDRRRRMAELASAGLGPAPARSAREHARHRRRR